MSRPLRIDFHVHITSPDVIARAGEYAKKDEYFRLLASSPKNRYATAEDALEEMVANNVDRAVVFGFAFRDMGLCREANDYVMEAVSRYPNRLIGFACVNPLARGLENEIDRCLAGGIRGVGELFPQGQGFEIDNQDHVRELAGLCRERNLPVLLHTNEPVGHYYPGKSGPCVREACSFAQNNRGLTVIFAHWGGGLCFYELMPELRDALVDVFYDTAATPFLYSKRIYDAIKAAGLVHKVLLGSDYPLLSPGRYMREMEQTGLTPHERDSIQGGNAVALLERVSGPA